MRMFMRHGKKKINKVKKPHSDFIKILRDQGVTSHDLLELQLLVNTDDAVFKRFMKNIIKKMENIVLSDDQNIVLSDDQNIVLSDDQHNVDFPKILGIFVEVLQQCQDNQSVKTEIKNLAKVRSCTQLKSMITTLNILHDPKTLNNEVKHQQQQQQQMAEERMEMQQKLQTQNKESVQLEQEAIVVKEKKMQLQQQMDYCKRQEQSKKMQLQQQMDDYKQQEQSKKMQLQQQMDDYKQQEQSKKASIAILKTQKQCGKLRVEKLLQEETEAQQKLESYDKWLMIIKQEKATNNTAVTLQQGAEYCEQQDQNNLEQQKIVCPVYPTYLTVGNYEREGYSTRQNLPDGHHHASAPLSESYSTEPGLPPDYHSVSCIGMT